MNRQPLVHVIDPSFFAFTLKSTLQVPKYREQVFFLVEKYLNLDCHMVEKVTRERDDALWHNKNWAAHHSKELEKATTAYNLKGKDLENQWRVYNTKKLAEQKASFDTERTSMQTDFNHKLNEEREKTKTALAKPALDFSSYRSKLEQKARHQEQRASNFEHQLLQARTGFDADRAAYEARIKAQEVSQLQLKAKLESHENEERETLADQSQRLLYMRAMSELLNKEVGRLLEVKDPQLDRLERKDVDMDRLRVGKKQQVAELDQKLLQEKAETEAARKEIEQQMGEKEQLRQRLQEAEVSEAAKERHIADLTRQLEECRSALGAKATEAETLRYGNRALLKACDQKLCGMQKDLDKVHEDRTQQKSIAEMLQKRLNAQYAFSGVKAEENIELSRQLIECQSALRRKAAEVENSKTDSQSEVSALTSELQQCRRALPTQTAEMSRLKDEAVSGTSVVTPEHQDCWSASEIQPNDLLLNNYPHAGGPAHRTWPSVSSNTSSTLTDLADPIVEGSNEEVVFATDVVPLSENSGIGPFSKEVVDSNLEETMEGASQTETVLSHPVPSVGEPDIHLWPTSDSDPVIASPDSLPSIEEPRSHLWPTPGFEEFNDASIMHPSPTIPKKMSWLEMDKMNRRGGAPMQKKPEPDHCGVSAQYKADFFAGAYPLDDYPLISVSEPSSSASAVVSRS